MPSRKSLSTRDPVLVAPPPTSAVIELGRAGEAAARVMVKEGQQVRTGEPIAAPAGADGACVHASITGRVTAIGPRLVAGSAGPVPCIALAGDGTDDWMPASRPPDPATLDAATIRELITQAGIVGLGGACFPTARKLAAGEPTLLLLNGAECEPYISCDDMLLRERAALVVRGGQVLLAATGAQRCVIAVKTDMADARIALWNAINAAADPRLSLSVVTAKYPVGGERQLIELVTGREVPAGGLPTDAGCLCQNVATAAAIASFFDDGRPLLSRIVTVSGGGIAAPRNIEARIGTPVRELIALAGGYQYQPDRLVMGGPMMGVALADDELPITLATNSILALTAMELGRAAPEMPCIRCGACVEACPARLLPQELLLAARRHDVPLLDELGLDACIECGACDYVCPSQIPLTRGFMEAKAGLADHRWTTARAAGARRNTEAREARLARATAERDRQLDEQLPPGSTAASGKPQLDELLDRVRNRPGRSDGGS